MTNEEKILKLLQTMQTEMSTIKTDVSTLKSDVSTMKAEMNERFDSLEASMKFAWQDIGFVEEKIDEKIKAHEELYHEAV